MENKIKSEIRRFKKFQRMITAKNDIINIKDVDIRNYAKFILKEGEIEEKRELLGNLRSRILYKDKKLTLLAE